MVQREIAVVLPSAESRVTADGHARHRRQAHQQGSHGLIVTLTLMTLVVILSGCAKERSSGPCISARPDIRDPVWRVDTLAIADRTIVHSVWMASAGTAYAAGGVDDGSQFRGVVWRFDGAQWTVAYDKPGTILRGIHGTSSDNVWAVGGATGWPHAGFGGLYVVHWDGERWIESLVDSSASGLFSVWSEQTAAYAGGAKGLIMEWNGLTWTSGRNDLSQSPRTTDITDIWGVSDYCSQVTQELYLVAWPMFKLLHYSADQWVTEPSPGGLGPSSSGYLGLCGDNTNGLYVLNEEATSTPWPYGTVHRRMNGTWSQTSLVWEPGKFSTIRNDQWGTVYVIKSGGVYRLVGDSVVAYNSMPVDLTKGAWVEGLTLMVAGKNGKAVVVAVGTF